MRPLFYAVLLLCLPAAAWAADDGFGDASRIASEHFDIFYKSGVDINTLISQLNISQSDQVLTGQSIDTASQDKQLASMLDVLFARAGDVLDMHLYSYKGNIKVFATQEQLRDFFYAKYHQDLPCNGVSFYLDDFNSIYISAADFRREVLGHEMGHTVMSHYFVVQPSVKIQEVLAGYVEYQLRKSK